MPGSGRCQPHGRGLRNYLTYFFVYSVRWVRTCARARLDPGTPVGHAPVRSEVFERRWPPGPVAIEGSDGLAVYDRMDGWIHLWLANDWILVCTWLLWNIISIPARGECHEGAIRGDAHNRQPEIRPMLSSGPMGHHRSQYGFAAYPGSKFPSYLVTNTFRSDPSGLAVSNTC